MTIFILFTVGILFVSLIFYTFETLLLIGLFYILTLPLSFYFFNKQDKKFKDDSKEDDHEDIL